MMRARGAIALLGREGLGLQGTELDWRVVGVSVRGSFF